MHVLVRRRMNPSEISEPHQMNLRPALSDDVADRKASNKQSNKMIRQHKIHFHRRMHGHTRLMSLIPPGHSTSPHGRDKKSGTILSDPRRYLKV